MPHAVPSPIHPSPAPRLCLLVLASCLLPTASSVRADPFTHLGGGDYSFEVLTGVWPFDRTTDHADTYASSGFSWDSGVGFRVIGFHDGDGDKLQFDAAPLARSNGGYWNTNFSVTKPTQLKSVSGIDPYRFMPPYPLTNYKFMNRTTEQVLRSTDDAGITGFIFQPGTTYAFVTDWSTFAFTGGPAASWVAVFGEPDPSIPSPNVVGVSLPEPCSHALSIVGLAGCLLVVVRRRG